ncbi:hypothetical protein [Consotaella aegiceratis]|uniref:hypothetical protein n=1 Tax=Consotaella aegiceratis TaxID=3097961 RepID=UPI002F3EDBBC
MPLPTRHSLKLFGRSVPLPASRLFRLIIGGLLVFFGFLGFLPILGFWMAPLGLMVLSIDLPMVRRWRRRFVVWWQRRFGNGVVRTNGRDPA